MSQYSVFIDTGGNLTMAAGMVHCLHGTSTYFRVGGGSASALPSVSGGLPSQRKISAEDSFLGGSGRNYVVSGGPQMTRSPRASISRTSLTSSLARRVPC